MINKSVQRMASAPGFPDLHIQPFELPLFPDDVRARFPSLELWTERFEIRHREWEQTLQSALEKALQVAKTPP